MSDRSLIVACGGILVLGDAERSSSRCRATHFDNYLIKYSLKHTDFSLANINVPLPHSIIKTLCVHVWK